MYKSKILGVLTSGTITLVFYFYSHLLAYTYIGIPNSEQLIIVTMITVRNYAATVGLWAESFDTIFNLAIGLILSLLSLVPPLAILIRHVAMLRRIGKRIAQP